MAEPSILIEDTELFNNISKLWGFNDISELRGQDNRLVEMVTGYLKSIYQIDVDPKQINVTVTRTGPGKAPTPKGWFACPKCGQRILKVAEGARSEKLFIKCKQCRNEIEIKIGDVSQNEPENRK